MNQLGLGQAVRMKDGRIGTIVGKGHFGWRVRFGDWVHYPIYANDMSPLVGIFSPDEIRALRRGEAL